MTNETVRLVGREESTGEPGNGTAEVLQRLQESTLALLAGLDRAPKSLRIRADQVEIELAWPEQPVVAVQPVPGPATAVATEPAPTAEDGTKRYLTAHTVGVFYQSPEPGSAPFVEVGDEVVPGQQIGVIEAMKLMIAVEAEEAGRIVEVLVPNGTPVEYGQKLFAVEPVQS